MTSKKDRRPTIYDIAQALNIAPSSVSKALNDSSSVSDKVKVLVRNKAQELNYRHNSQAASLRKGTSRTIGVIVPKINSAFFSNAISGMEEVCFNHSHQLIICQTEESYAKEKQAVDTLITNNVDCIIISQSIETKGDSHLREVIKRHTPLIQFDRVNQSVSCHQVVNDNKTAAYHAVKELLNQGYKSIAFLGGSLNMHVYNERREGYLQAVKENGMMIPYDYVVADMHNEQNGYEVATTLLNSSLPPDAFLTSSDYIAFGVMKAVFAKGLSIPDDVGVIGFANEPFSSMIVPSLTTVDQNSRAMGIETANIYFTNLMDKQQSSISITKTVPCTIIYRDSTRKRID
ncbi:LacI family DNA-binding transcriptional regulator [Parapedobacter pyrenivorans]|uniref:LacI family DNA-binding transcriptional regulator n=1 Tax=Parapedobacter pyrenivorans TaxID=1305674 RepID=UPI00333FBE53